MTFYVENEIDAKFDFPIEETVEKVIKKALEYEKFPYESEINVLITNEAGIKEYNKEYRDIDKPTDVLSFPAVDYDFPCDFSYIENDKMSYINPETNEVLLGDIILCYDKIVSQAKEYGHSELREFSFLIAHSMLHLLGYDHMEENEEKEMFSHQESIMNELGILR